MDKDLIMLILVGFCILITIVTTGFSVYILKINNFKKLKKDVVDFSNTLEYLKTDVSNSYNTLLSDIKYTKRDYIQTLETAKKEAHVMSNRIQLLISELDSCLIDKNKVSKDYLLKKYPENRTNFNIRVRPNTEQLKDKPIDKEVTIGDLVNNNNKKEVI